VFNASDFVTALLKMDSEDPVAAGAGGAAPVPELRPR